MRLACSILIAALALTACAKEAAPGGTDIRRWTIEDATIFPGDRSLRSPEDGVALPDGTLIAADRKHGLIALSPDGAHRPFGSFEAAGYDRESVDRPGGANGVSMEPDGGHILVADALTGAIYRVDIASETASLIYNHEFGVNTAISDSSGAIWFTQSTENTGPDSEARSFAPVDTPMTDGALYRIAPAASDAAAPVAELKVSGIQYANGVVIDEARGTLYVAATMADSIDHFAVNIATGALSDRSVLATIITPDNIEIDEAGWLWVASVIGNEIFVIDPESGAIHSVFHPQTPETSAVMTEWNRRTDAGEARLDLLGPDMWGPMPGLLTGIILPPGASAVSGGPVYLTGLGDGLVRLGPATP